MKKKTARPLVNLSQLGLTPEDIQNTPTPSDQHHRQQEQQHEHDDTPGDRAKDDDDEEAADRVAIAGSSSSSNSQRQGQRRPMSTTTRRIRRKRPAHRPPTHANDIYLSRKTRWPAVEARVKRLLYPVVEKQGKHKIPLSALMKPELHALAQSSSSSSTSSSSGVVVLHALGALLPRAISVATLICERSHGDIVVDKVTTTTTQLVDDIIVTTDINTNTNTDTMPSGAPCDPQATDRDSDKMDIVQGDNQNPSEPHDDDDVHVRFNSGIHIVLKRRS